MEGWRHGLLEWPQYKLPPPCTCVHITLETGIAAGVVVVLFVFCSLLCAPVWMGLRRRLGKLGEAALNSVRRRRGGEGSVLGLRYYPKGKLYRSQRRAFTLIELSDATKGFHCKHKLGVGGFGSVYKGVLADGSMVAVKRCSALRSDHGQQKQFLAEISLVTELTHPNLVPLKGWCRENCELLLVYDFMPNGSLDRHVRESVLPWPRRYSFVVDIAKALQFLHSRCRNGCIIHRDVKASNVLIDGQMKARLGDFGMARQVEFDRTPLNCSSIAGTKGYMAPEAAYGFKATDRTDVFSFGVLVLEIVAGRPPIDMRRPPEEAILIDWVWQLHVAGRILEAADKRLLGHYSLDEMSRLLHLGLLCSSPDPKGRCSMDVVMEVLTLDGPVPPLPNWRPVPFFTAEQPTQEPQASQSPSPWRSPSPSPKLSASVAAGSGVPVCTALPTHSCDRLQDGRTFSSPPVHGSHGKSRLRSALSVLFAHWKTNESVLLH